jgi:hypothetical protein
MQFAIEFILKFYLVQKQMPPDQPLSMEAAALLHLPMPKLPAQTGFASGMAGEMSIVGGSSTANAENKEEGEQTSEQQAAQNDAMNSMMQMGFPMNPEQMQQQMMMMQQQMMHSGNADNTTNNGQGSTDKAEDGNQTNASGNVPDMSAMMAMGGMPGMPDMQTMMNMFGMGMPGMNGMQDMTGFQNMAQGE